MHYHIKEKKEWKERKPSSDQAKELERCQKVFFECVPQSMGVVYTLHQDGVDAQMKGGKSTYKAIVLDQEKFEATLATVARVLGVDESRVQIEIAAPPSLDELYPVAMDLEIKFSQQIEKAITYLRNKEEFELLQGLNDLQRHSRKMLEFMEQVNELSKGERYAEAASMYTKEFASVYPPYADALIKVHPDVSERVENDEKFPLPDFDRFDFHTTLFEATIQAAQKGKYHPDLEEALQSFKLKNSFFTSGPRAQRLVEEAAVQAVYRDLLLLARADGNALYKDIDAIYEHSLLLTEALENVDTFFLQGKYVEAMDKYADAFEKIYLPYLQLVAKHSEAIEQYHNIEFPEDPFPELALINQHLPAYEEALELLKKNDYPTSRWELPPEIKESIVEEGKILEAPPPPPLLFNAPAFETLLRLDSSILNTTENAKEALLKDRKLLTMCCIKNGISEVDITNLISFFENVSEHYPAMVDRLNEVKKQAEDTEFEDAIDLYAKAIRENYVDNIWLFEEGKRLQTLLQPKKEALKVSYKNYLLELKKEYRHLDFSFLPLYDVLDSFLDQPLEHHTFAHEMWQVSPHRGWTVALGGLTEVKEALDREQENLEELFTDDDSLVKRVYSEPNANKATMVAFNRTLGRNGWNGAKVVKLNRLNRSLIKRLRPVYEAKLALDAERDPSRRRFLYAHLTRLAKEAGPQIAKFNKELKELGGVEKTKALVKALENYGGGLDEVRRAKDQVNLFIERLAFYNDILDSAGLVMAEPLGRIERSLLKSPLKDDDRWVNSYRKQKLTEKQIGKIGETYDEFLKAYAPLYIAKKRLDYDPDNKALQKGLRDTLRKQEPKLQKLRKELGKAQTLSDAIADCSRSLPENEQEKVRYLLQGDILPDFLRIENEILAIRDECDWSMGWDEHSVSKLLLDNPIAEHISLKRYQDTIDEIDKLFDGMKKELAPIQTATRAIEKEPTNPELYRNLRRLMTDERADRVGTLNDKYLELKEQIDVIQKRLNELEGSLRREGKAPGVCALLKRRNLLREAHNFLELQEQANRLSHFYLQQGQS